MKWKYVFNSQLDGFYYGHIDSLIEVVKKTGYKFFTHNGQIYSIDTKKYIGIDVDELI